LAPSWNTAQKLFVFSFVKEEQILAHIIRSQIIHKQSGRYVAWPMVARAANG